ncbi:MAG TPA: helix-turn-helix domain-containing protein [Trebonia sp.]|jgi:hypothetical protein
MPEEKKTPDPKTPDPRALRALAHPLRWQLIDLIGSEGTATATRCAEVLGESVASCSYHLGILAKYGYVEESPDRTGREKPWRLISAEQDPWPKGLDTEGELAAEAATEAFLDYELERTKQRLRRKSLEPEEWWPKLAGETTWLTEEEYAAVWGELYGVLERYRRDWGARDLSKRPAGGRTARLFISLGVAPPVPGRGEAERPPRGEQAPPPRDDDAPPKGDLRWPPGSARSATPSSGGCSPGRHCPASATAPSTSRSGSGPRP